MSNKLESFFKDKVVLILGLGKTGKSVFSALSPFARIQIFCFDDNNQVLNDFLTKHKNVHRLDPILHAENFDKIFDYVIVSPGISPDNLIFKKAVKANIILSDIDLLFLRNPNSYYIGITGTNGKSTVATLVYSILQSSDMRYELCGNIGICGLDLPESPGYVIEISSYQLDIMCKSIINNVKLDICVLLNIQVDHLDRYKTFAAYVNSKKQIFNHLKKEGKAIVCMDKKDTMYLDYFTKLLNNFSGKLTLICNNLLQKYENGMDLKTNHDTQLSCQNQKATMASNIEHINNKCNGIELEILNIKNGILTNNQERINFSHLHFSASATYMQASVAYTVCRILKLDSEKITKSISEFKGLKHRMQSVGSKANLTFINDSKSTNISCCINALEYYKNIYWIAGGKCSDENYALIQGHLQNVKSAYFFGQSAQNFFSKLKDKIRCMEFNTLDHAFYKAVQDALLQRQNSSILFSPGCKSFDQFANFEVRGEEFIKLCELFFTKQNYKNGY